MVDTSFGGNNVKMVKTLNEWMRVKWMAKNGMILHYLPQRVISKLFAFYSLPQCHPEHASDSMVMTLFFFFFFCQKTDPPSNVSGQCVLVIFPCSFLPSDCIFTVQSFTGSGKRWQQRHSPEDDDMRRKKSTTKRHIQKNQRFSQIKKFEKIIRKWNKYTSHITVHVHEATAYCMRR